MEKDTVKITIELTRKNADIVDEFKKELGVSEGRSKAESILVNMIFTKLRTPILSLFKVPLEKAEPTTYLKEASPSSNIESQDEKVTSGRLKPIEF
jgi:hypothetical protein